MRDSIIWTFIIIGAAGLLTIILVRLVLWINEFSGELKYINTEIKRSRGSEKKYWKKARKELWLSAIFPKR